jgi:arylformamidase
MSEWIDISFAIDNGMLHWPGDVPVAISKSADMGRGDDANVTVLHFSAHTGTHIDAPLHFLKNGNDVSAIELNRLIGNVKIIQIENKKEITVEELKSFDINHGDNIFFKTSNSQNELLKFPFTENFVYLSSAAAVFLRDKGVTIVGIDYLSVSGMNNAKEVHTTLLKNNILIIEGLVLKDITPGEYEMICLPLKIKNADGAPARVIIRKSD